MKKPFSFPRVSAFTSIELIIVLTVMTLLTAAAVTNYYAAKLSVRDGSRRSDVRTLQGAVLNYQLAYGNAFIRDKKVSGSCTVPTSAGTATTYIADPLTNPACTGSLGRSYGKINMASATVTVSPNIQRQYAPISIGQALKDDGFLNTIPKDPSNRNVSDPHQPDYVLIRCGKDGLQHIGDGGSRFGIWTQLEGSPTNQENSNTITYCGGKDPDGQTNYPFDFSVPADQLTKNVLAIGNEAVNTQNICKKS